MRYLVLTLWEVNLVFMGFCGGARDTGFEEEPHDVYLDDGEGMEVYDVVDVGAVSDVKRDDATDFDMGGDEQMGCPSTVVCGTPPVCCDEDEECIGDRCVPVCPSGIRCGEELLACCDEGQVCVSSECITPGEECMDSYDCGLDMFCEPTIGRCLPQFDPVTCEVRVEPQPFEVTVEWAWTGSAVLPDYDQPISAPVVIDLDGDRIPEVVFNAARRRYWRDGVLRAIRGDTGEDFWAVTDPPAPSLWGRSSIAAGDIDGDGHVEIIGISRGSTTGGEDSAVLCFNWDGSLRWATDGIFTVNNGGPTLADLDGDGKSEIVVGASVIDYNGSIIWNNGSAEGTNATYVGGLPAVADIDGDAVPEIVTGAKAWEADGTLIWDSEGSYGTYDGYPGVADFDLDGQPEIVVIGSGYVQILNASDGSPYWPAVAIPGGGIGGPPTVADFDGDTYPEIGVAGGDSYSVYDPGSSEPIVWSCPTQDHSSNATGSSVFDFEGDGVAEVIYCDECFMRVYAGQSGEPLLKLMNSSLTIHEYPLVADVDGDGNSEILVVANDWWFGTSVPSNYCDSWLEESDPPVYQPRHGVFLYGDSHDKWVPTRRIWNEHTYHVTNVLADGSIPAHEDDNWRLEGLNNYRQNVQGEGVFNAPDLVITSLSVDLSGCPGTATVRATVVNEGCLGVRAGTVIVYFYKGIEEGPSELVGSKLIDVDLLPGASTVVTLEVELSGEPPFSFYATVEDNPDDDELVVECNYENNSSSIEGIDCSLII